MILYCLSSRYLAVHSGTAKHIQRLLPLTLLCTRSNALYGFCNETLIRPREILCYTRYEKPYAVNLLFENSILWVKLFWIMLFHIPSPIRFEIVP